MASARAFDIREAASPADVAACRDLFAEYQRSIGVSLCFQGFDAELAGLPGDYARPRGRLYVALRAGRPVACVALRPLEPGVAELKRLYVRPESRGAGLGRALVQAALAAARDIGYESIRLDTLPSMGEAQALYEAMGFVETEPYNDNPVAGVRFLERALKP